MREFMAAVWRVFSAVCSRERRSIWPSTVSDSPRVRWAERLRASTSLRSWASSWCTLSSVALAHPATAIERTKGSQRLPLVTTACMPADSPRLAGLRQEVVPAILGPAGFGLLRAHRALLAIRDDGDAVGLDPLRDEVVHGCLGALLTEGEVVLGRAALVTVALDQHEVLAVRLEPGRVAVEDLGVARTDVVLVEVEVDRLEIRILFELARLRHRRGSRSRSGRRSSRRGGGRRGRGRRSRRGLWRGGGRGYSGSSSGPLRAPHEEKSESEKRHH